MNVTFYKVDKCRNETKIPSDGVTLAVRLKESSSVRNPVLLLSTDAIWSYNYFYIDTYKRYYFVTNITFLGNQTYQINGEVDPMASFRSEILASSQYILRAATGFDTDITDSYFPAKNGYNYNIASVNLIEEDMLYQEGTFVLGVIGPNAGFAGLPVTYYLMYYQDIVKLNDYLFNSGSYGNMLSDDVVKAFFNPMDYIISCMYFPYTITAPVGVDASDIKFGWFTATGVTGYILNSYESDPTAAHGVNLTIPIHKPYSDYRKNAPYTRYLLYIPFIGKMELDNNKIYDCTNIYIKLRVDLVSGAMKSAVYGLTSGQSGEGGRLLYRDAGQIGCPVSLAQLRTDLSNVVKNTVGVAGSLMKLDIAGAISGVVDGVKSVVGEPDTKDSNGAIGLVFFQRAVELITYWVDTATPNSMRLGRPVCKQDTVSNYSGFCLCSNAEVEATGAYAEEIDTINGFLNGGFYVN